MLINICILFGEYYHASKSIQRFGDGRPDCSLVRDKPHGKDLSEFRALANEWPRFARRRERARGGAGAGVFCNRTRQTGNYHVTGVDISKTFVEIARKNAAIEGVQVDFRQGNAASMPFGEGSFDLILCRAAFKNFSGTSDGAQGNAARAAAGRKGCDYRSAQGCAEGSDRLLH